MSSNSLEAREAELAHLDEVESAFKMTVEEGVRRLERSWPALLATGFMGGVDVSIGVFGLYVVQHITDGNKVLASLAFSIGFIALTLAKSELFTENFLVPIAAAVTERAGFAAVGRLWVGTAIMNLVGGWIVNALVMGGFPTLHETAVELGHHFVEIGTAWRAFASAMIGGVIITLMTWMIEGSKSTGAKIVAAVSAGFLLTAGEINHCIVASLEMFGGLVAGAPYSYLDWLAVFLWAALGNIVGGIALVTVLRFVQVGGQRLRQEQLEQAMSLEEPDGDGSGGER